MLAIDAGVRLRQQALLVNAAPAAEPRFNLVVSPSGHPRVVVAVDERDAVTGAKGSAVATAFEGGAGRGVLHLGAVEVLGEVTAARLQGRLTSGRQ